MSITRFLPPTPPSDPELVELFVRGEHDRVVWPMPTMFEAREVLLVMGALTTVELARLTDPTASWLALVVVFRLALAGLLFSSLVTWWRWARHSVAGYIPLALRGKTLVHAHVSDVLLLGGLLTYNTSLGAQGIAAVVLSLVVQVFLALPVTVTAKLVHAEASDAALVAQSRPFFSEREPT